MKANQVQQEILLMTGTTFSARQFYSNNNGDGNSHLSEKAQLEEACWNGLLQQMLPEIYECPDSNIRLYLWQIKEAKSFIEIELGQLPGVTEKHFSIDPYLFSYFQILS